MHRRRLGPGHARRGGRWLGARDRGRRTRDATGRGLGIEARARGVALGIAAGRIGLGAGALLATGPALRLLGFPDPDPPARALGMLAGGRDIVLGALPFLFRDQRQALRHAAAAGATVDAIDAVGLGVMAARRRELGRAGVVGALSGGTAALAGAWAALRLSA